MAQLLNQESVFSSSNSSTLSCQSSLNSRSTTVPLHLNFIKSAVRVTEKLSQFGRKLLRDSVSVYYNLSTNQLAAKISSCDPLCNPRFQHRPSFEALSEALLSFGASSAYMDDLSDFGDLDEICITSIFPQEARVKTCISEAVSSIDLQYSPSYDISVGKQCDWVSNVQRSFQPTQVTDGLWVVPAWREPLDLRATNIILDPGLAFGTGEHPTTKLCLMLLHKIIKGGEHNLDYGTGSGILGIAALKMGASLSVGLDIDPHAITSARQNAALNNIDPSRMPLYLVSSKTGSASPDATIHDLDSRKGEFDIIIANILLNPLMELAEDIISYGKPGSIIGLSGILTEQVPRIKERYSKYLDRISISEMDGWARLDGTKKRL